jgi:hypothetical protein
MATGLAWVLNLDADLELGAGAGYRPKRSVRRAMRAHADGLAVRLLGPNDIVVDEETPALAARGRTGRAFCPTPLALHVLRRVGAHPEPHPSVEILQRVNSRAFASSLGTTLASAAFVGTFDLAETLLRGEPPIGNAWRVKHAFGMAGRNQRIVTASSFDGNDRAFVRSGIAQGGVQIEPNVAVEDEYAVHGVIAEDGSYRIGAVVRQRCNARGAWIATEAETASLVSPGESLGDVFNRIADEGRRVARALFDAGFFGPFGVDAYTYRDRGGALRLQPRSEINARYTMGFPVGFQVEGEAIPCRSRGDGAPRPLPAPLPRVAPDLAVSRGASTHGSRVAPGGSDPKSDRQADEEADNFRRDRVSSDREFGGCCGPGPNGVLKEPARRE